MGRVFWVPLRESWRSENGGGVTYPVQVRYPRVRRIRIQAGALVRKSTFSRPETVNQCQSLTAAVRERLLG